MFMKRSPLVSVVIPCFNCEAYLAEAIESALAQTYPNVEIIVVDDASTDGSLAIARCYEPRIKIISYNVNRERSWCRNKAVELSSGKFIALLDGDDIWVPEKLSRQMALFDDSLVGVVYSNAYIYEFETSANRIDLPTYDSRRRFPLALPMHNVDVALFKENPVVASSAMIRREAFGDVGGFDLVRSILGAEDLDLWLRISRAGWCFQYVDAPLVYYRMHSQQTTMNSDVMCFAIQSVYARYLDKVRGARCRSEFREAYERILHMLEEVGVRATYAERERSKAIKAYCRLVCINPRNLKWWRGLFRGMLIRPFL